MARLLIVSRSMALAMRLADQHEVNEHPVDDLEALGTDLDADVLVLDLGDPMQAVTTVNGLREAGQVTPVLLVSGYQPEWEQVEAQQVDGVVVVPLPITRAALLAGIAELTGAPEPVLDAEASTDVVPVAGGTDAADVPPAEDSGEEPAPASGSTAISELDEGDDDPDHADDDADDDAGPSASGDAPDAEPDAGTEDGLSLIHI